MWVRNWSRPKCRRRDRRRCRTPRPRAPGAGSSRARAPSACKGASGGHDRRRSSPSRMTNASSATYSAPKTVVIQACRPSFGSSRVNAPTPTSTMPTATSSRPLPSQDLRGTPRRARRRGRGPIPSDGERRVAGAAEEPERLHGGEDRDQRDRGGQRPPPPRNERRRAGPERARAALIARCRMVRPARPVSARSGVCGWRTPSSAASKASGPKSGQSGLARVELGVGRLPDQEVATAAARRRSGSRGPGPGRPAVYSARAIAASSISSGGIAARDEAPHGVDDLRPAGVVERDVEQQPVAVGGRLERLVDRRPGSRRAARRGGRAAGPGRPARAARRSRCGSPPRAARTARSTSSSVRAQFSRLKAYRDRTGTPRRTAWRRSSRIASTPAAWPSSSGRSRWRAQRRLPSMMIATWSRQLVAARKRRVSSAGAAGVTRVSVSDGSLMRRGRRVGRAGQLDPGH